MARVKARVKSVRNAGNRRELLTFVDEERNRVKPSTLNARLDAILPLAEHLGKRPWRKATRRDIIHVVANHVSKQGAHLRTRTGRVGKPLADSTKFQHVVMLGFYYRWLLDLDRGERAPQFRRLPFRKVDAMANRLRVLMLTPAEVKKLLAAAGSERDRAIILVGLETCFRVSEMAALRLDFMEKRNGGYWMTLPPDAEDLKTGVREVPVPVIAAKKTLEAWLEVHPRKHERSAPLFVTLSNRSFGKKMTGASISAVVERCARRAKIRRITGHVLRHCGTSFKVVRKVPAEVIRLTAGWTKKSTMMQHYTHVAGFFQSMVLQSYGIEDEEPELMDVIGSQACLLCGETIHVAVEECSGCGVPNSDAVVAGEQARQRNAAVGYVAIELATACGWKPEGEARVEAAIAFLSRSFEGLGGEGDDDFVKWCLVEWARKCGNKQ